MKALLLKLRSLPAEVWTLAVLPSFFLIYIFYTSKINFAYFFGSVENGYLNYFLYFVPPHAQPAIIIITLYATSRTLLWLGFKIGRFLLHPSHNQSWHKTLLQVILKNLSHISLYVFAICIGSLVMICKLLYIGTNEASHVAETSLRLMQLDMYTFGVYVPFWLQGHSWSLTLDTIALEAYMLLSTVLTTIILGLLALRGQKYFRAFILSFFMTSALATPIWMNIPAVTPNELYRENVLSLDRTTPEAMYALQQSAHIGPKTAALLTEVDNLQSKPEIQHWHVPTFPSMHVGWGLVFVYFGFIIAWPIGVILSMWWLLNIVGAVLSLQHYGVDVLAGTLIGALAIGLAHLILRTEKTYLTIPAEQFSFLDYLYNDLKNLQSFLIKRAQVFKKK